MGEGERGEPRRPNTPHGEGHVGWRDGRRRRTARAFAPGLVQGLLRRHHALGIVYYANYFKFLERGRAEYLEAEGRSVADWNREGYLFVVHAVTAKFKRPATLGDTIDIVTSFRHASPFRGIFDQRVERGGEVLLTAAIDVACLDADQNLRRLPTSLGT